MKAILARPISRAVCAIFVVCLLHATSLIGLYHKAHLFTSGRTVDAVITAYQEEDVEGEYSIISYSNYEYEFHDEHGSRVRGSHTQDEANPLNVDVNHCPCPARVIYLADDSSINSLMFPGSETWVRFIWDNGYLRTLLSIGLYAMIAYQALRYFFPTAHRSATASV